MYACVMYFVFAESADARVRPLWFIYLLQLYLDN